MQYGAKYVQRPLVVTAYQAREEMTLQTLDGVQQVYPGDYIITGANGEPYVCKPDVFQLTYIPESEYLSTNKAAKADHPPPENKDAVNHPAHYNVGHIEVIEAVEAWQLGFSLGSAVKYIARAGHKDDALQDLQKAAWYIEREIGRLQKEQAK